MLRAIAFPIIAFLLISSLLAPPVMSLFDKECSIAMMLSPEEEEKGNEKEAEKKLDEKNLFLTDEIASQMMSLSKKKKKSTEHMLSFQDYKAEILVPPPRNIG